MNSKVLWILLAMVNAGLAISSVIFMRSTAESEHQLVLAAEHSSSMEAELTKLRDELKKTSALVPDQAAVMSHVGYHFSNLWFAAQQENWPLADFYLGETRANVKWAVRAKPFRKAANGQDIDLGAIAQALDNTNFTALKKAIDEKQKAQFTVVYTETLGMCYACHKTSGKPYLRPQIPASPEMRMINLDPNAKSPE